MSTSPGLTLKDLFISDSSIEIEIELNFYFHTSLSGIGPLRVKQQRIDSLQDCKA